MHAIGAEAEMGRRQTHLMLPSTTTLVEAARILTPDDAAMEVRV